ncbi:hexitol phosphatase HxpB [Ferruginibacter sp. SUN106]|uniref:hexitol phosphatase HxpB n=1 Tax=Ferruginibacter sp. SUN106 TaxID=2978348 RepID=UPI003D35F28B
MQLNTVIFDMDGLLIDSEPLWNEASAYIFGHYGIHLTPQQYATTTGLRTKEFITHWFNHFKIPLQEADIIEKDLIDKVIELVLQKGKPMPGLSHIFNFFIDRNFKTGIASSSPRNLIDVVVDLLNIRPHLHTITSAALLANGKPHPEVYLNCAAELKAAPAECICFEDSFPGMIAVKAARMKCVVVPDPKISKELKWHAADLRISSLQNFNELLLQSLY